MPVQVTTDVNTEVGRNTSNGRRWLVVAHAAWLVCAALALIVLFFALPGYLRLFTAPDLQLVDAPPAFVVLMRLATVLASVGIVALCLALAALLFWRKRAETMALVTSFFLLAYGIAWGGALENALSAPQSEQGRILANSIGSALTFIPTLLLLFLFPSGHFVPRRTRWILIASLLLTPLLVVVPQSALYSSPLTSTLDIALFMFVVVGLFAQIYRYRRVSNAIEREQTKGFVHGLFLAIGLGLVASLAYPMILNSPPGEPLPWWAPIAQLGWIAAIAVIPLSLTLAIMRYRLWDIDIIINRTLVYGTLSAGIVVTYILLVGLLGTLLNTDVNLAAAIVTLALTAFLFRPLHTRLQRRVDRVIHSRHASANPADREESHADTSAAAYRRLAWAIASLSLAFVTIGGIFFLLAWVNGAKQTPALHLFFSPVITVTFSLAGALVASRHPRNPIGWILLAVGFLSALNLDAPAYRMLSEAFAPQNTLPGVQVAEWLDLWVWIPLTLIPFTFLLLLFPQGHLPSPRWQPIAWASALGLAGITCAVAFAPSPSVASTSEINPFGIPGAAAPMAILQNVASFLLAVGFFGSVAALIVRARRSRGIEREQIKWLVYAVVLGILINLMAGIPYLILPNDVEWYDLSILASEVALCCIVIAAGIAILRYRLYDIDIIVNRTLVYGALTAGIVALYILLVGAFGTLSQTSGNLFLSLLATGLIAVLFQPLRERLQRGVNRLTYGERDDPYRVLTRLGAQLESAMEPSAALTQTVETVAGALKLPYVAIALKRDDTMQTVAAHGAAPKVVSGFPLIHAGEPIGELVAAPRTPNEALAPADERLLRDLARQISIAARTAALTSDLEQARLRIVTERGEARRQLGSDLHDGVGHQLVALTRQIERVMPKEPNSSAQVSNEFLADIKQRLLATTTQVRSLAHQLYPPELEVLGLSGALRERAHAYPTFRISVDAPEPFPPLPAEIETAAYYIALEALTNVAKHAHAATCHIRLRLSPAEATSPLRRLEMDIVDDGRGLSADDSHGLGMLSMRARAAEVGGSCDIVPNPGSGTAVRVRIPCVIKAV